MTPLLRWKPEYSVNDAELDSHHLKLFNILNNVYENVMNAPEVDNVIPILDELSLYTKFHFSEEEQHMRERGFLDVDAHIAKHREFTQTIEALKTNYRGNNLEVTRELLVLLGNWLLKHVLTEDRKYSGLSAGNSV